MKKKKTNIVSENIISEEDFKEFEEFENESDESEATQNIVPKKAKKLPIGTILVVTGLIAVTGVLGVLVVKKFTPTNKDFQSSVVVEEEPEAPFVSVSTTPSPTQLPTATPTVPVTVVPEEEPIIPEEPITSVEEENSNVLEGNLSDLSATEENTENINEEDLILEELESSLTLEETEESKINESYKDISVYYVDELKTFHKKDCAVIKDKNKIKTTAYAALSNNFENCTKCNPLNNDTLSKLSSTEIAALNDIPVYKTASNTKYHTKDCSILKDTGILTTLKEVIENNLEACSLCNPKTLDNYKDSSSNTSNKITPTPTSSKNNNSTNNTSNNTTNTNTNTIITVVPTITKVPVSLISITGGTVKVGEKLQLYVSFLPTNAVSLLTYKVQNPAIASIEGDGKVTGIAPGKTTVSITAENGVTASATIEVITSTSTTTPTPSVTITPSTTPTATPTPTPSYTDTNLDINNLGLTGISKFVYPSNINLIDMEAMSDWQSFLHKITANGGNIVVSNSTVTLSAGGVTRLQLYKYDSNVWALRIYDSLQMNLNKCALKAFCTKISSMPDTLYTNIYEDYEVREFISDRYRTIGDASVKSEISGDSVTYYIKDVNYEY